MPIDQTSINILKLYRVTGKAKPANIDLSILLVFIMKQGINLLRILLENGNLCRGQRLYWKNFVIKQGVYRKEDISEMLSVGNFIDVCVESNIFSIGGGPHRC